MNILALDLATTVGWALQINGVLYSGYQCMKQKRNDALGVRFLAFRTWLAHKATHRPLKIYYELVPPHCHKSYAAAAMYHGLIAILLTYCEETGLVAEGINLATIKKHATGNGNAPKPAMIQAANRLTLRTHDPITDDNEADAVCLLFCAMDEKR